MTRLFKPILAGVIIAAGFVVLAEILVPVFAQARIYSGPGCAGELKWHGENMLLYLEANDDRFPPVIDPDRLQLYEDNPKREFIFSLKNDFSMLRYLSERRCPEDRSYATIDFYGVPENSRAWGKIKRRSYHYNEWLAFDGPMGPAATVFSTEPC